MNYPALIFWVLIFWSVAARPSTVLVLLLASISFSSLAILPGNLIGGMSILPLSMFSVVLIAKVLAPQMTRLSPRFLTLLQLRYLGFLALFLLIGILAAVIMPRLFIGDIVIIPMRESIGPEILVPIQANFTQSGYVALSVMTAFAVASMVDEPGFVKAFLAGVLTGGTVCIVTGLIDIAAVSTGMESLLEPFRNAGYAISPAQQVGAFRRVIGLTPEPSSYGPICVQFAAALSFLRTLFAEGRQRILATIVIGGLIVMALLSTSSTAYGGLAVFALCYAVNLFRRTISSSPLGRRGLLWELMVGLGLAIALLGIILVRAELFDPLIYVVNEIIFNKAQTTSFYERSMWNTIAWNSVGSTWGLGIGFGSTRTSNWLVAVVSNAGVIGAAALAIFVVLTFTRRPLWRTAESTELMSALKLSLLPALVMAAVESAGPDFGPWVAAVFGAITGLSFLRPRASYLNPALENRVRPRISERGAMRRRAFSGTATVPPKGGAPDSSSV
jgi:hypothetical protein